jgi:hypothetical protein
MRKRALTENEFEPTEELVDHTRLMGGALVEHGHA